MNNNQNYAKSVQWCNNDEISRSPICNFYKGKTVFLTGATGFLGQLLLEKLLRCNAKHVYVLARSKKNQDPMARFERLFEEEQFGKLKEGDPNFIERVSVIEGDLAELSAGIKSDDLQLLENTVEIILHVGADVRFNESLYNLVLTNLRGTRELLNLAKKCKQFKVFTYISTAFSNCPRGYYIKEDFYNPPMDPHIAIALAEKCTNNFTERDNFDIVTKNLIGEWPNTYTFSKSLSEELVRRYGNEFPICVVRPSIVISTYEDPLPGWCSNLFGISGLFIVYGFGISRLRFAKEKFLDVVCADFVINAILAATWATVQDTKQLQQALSVENQLESVILPKPKVFAIVATSERFTGNQYSEIILPWFYKSPSSNCVWIVCNNNTSCPFLYIYLTIFYHFIANVIFDFGLKITGVKIRTLPVARKIQVFLDALAYFMINEWHFECTNMLEICDRMHPTDKKLFACDTRHFNFKDFARSYTLGLIRCSQSVMGSAGAPVKEYSTEAALRRYKRLRIAHFFVRIAFYATQALIIYFLAEVFGLIGCLKGVCKFLIDPNAIMSLK